MHAKLERLLSKSLTTLEVMAYYLVVHTGHELFSTFLAHVNVILNLKIEMYIPLRPKPKGDTLLR